MITRNVKALLQRLNAPLTRALEGAAGFAVGRGHYEVAIEHWLMKLLEAGDGDLPLVLSRSNVEPGRVGEALTASLDRMKTGNSGRPVFSPLLLTLVERAWLLASVHHGLGSVRSAVLLEALLTDEAFAASPVREAFAGVSAEALQERMGELVHGSIENRPEGRTAGAPLAAGAASGDTALDAYTHPVTQHAREGRIDPIFGRDNEIRQMIDVLSRRRKNNPILVGEAGVGKTAVVEGLALRIAQGDVPDSLRDTEIVTLDLGALQAGAGVKGEFESRLKAVIDEVRAAPKPTILFIDEAHTLIGAGGAAGTGDAANLLKPALARGELRSIAATTWSEYKKHIEKDPALARRFQMVQIGEPSVESAVVMLRGIKEKYEQHHHVQISDAAIRAAAELSDRYLTGRQLPDKAVDLLDTAAARVKMTQAATPAALDDLQRRLHDLGTEIATVRRDHATGLTASADRLPELEAERDRLETERDELEVRWREEQALAREIEADRMHLAGAPMMQTSKAEGPEDDDSKEDDSKEGGDSGDDSGDDGKGGGGGGAQHGHIEIGQGQGRPEGDGAPSEAELAAAAGETPGDPGALREALAVKAGRLAAMQGDHPMVHAHVDEHVVARVVADWTGIPIGNMIKDEAALLLALENELGERVRGQDEALALLADTLRSAKAGLGKPDAPLGVFLLVGPSGVGKTETARALAELLFGGERFLVSINMSEYQESHTSAQLKGAPPGYVGYGEGGVLTEAVRRSPYSVVLLDEVEKAHLDVMELFYQVFDRGMMRDGEGREIDFSNTVILATSNIGSDVVQQACMAEERPSPDVLREMIHDDLARHFQPALLGRMRVVPFYSLERAAMESIARLKLGRIDRQLRARHGVRFDFSDDVITRIADRCTTVDAGARNIDFIIDRTVLPEASRALLARLADEDLPVAIELGIDEAGDFTYTFHDAGGDGASAEPEADAQAAADAESSDAEPVA